MSSTPTLEEYLHEREVAREPVPPSFTASQVAEISRVVFVPNMRRESDVLFVFGSSHNDWALVAELYQQGLSPQVLVTGRAGEDFFETGVPQSHRIRQSLLALGVPECAVLIEDGSDNTLQNARLGRKVLAANGINPTSILFVCKSHHSGRAWRTLAAAFPGTELTCVTYDATYGSELVGESSWPSSVVGRSRVYGEYERINLYSQRGDISVDGPVPVV